MDCETCGHPLAMHDPCSATVGHGKKAGPCACRRYEPHDRKVRAALITDTANAVPAPLEHARARDARTAARGAH